MPQLIITTKKQNPLYPLLVSVMGILIPLITLYSFPTMKALKTNNAPSFFTGLIILQIIRSLINIKKNKYTKSLNIITTVIGMILIGTLGYFPHFPLYHYFPFFYILLIMVKVTLFICVGFFLYKLATTLLNMVFNSTAPHTIVDKKGIWIKDYNLIPWQNIATLKSDQKNSLTTLKIIVKNKKQLFKHASLEESIRCFLTKKLTGYDISISNIDNIVSDEILNFYHLYGQQEQ